MSTHEEPVVPGQDEPPAQAVDLARTSANHITADFMRMRQSSVALLETDEAELHQSAVARLDSDSIQTFQSAVFQSSGESVKLERSALALGQAVSAELKNSVAGAVFTDTAVLEQSNVRLLVARNVTGPVKARVLLAGRVEGPVETALDTPRALLFGLAAGAGMGLVMWLSRLLKPRT